MLIRGKVMLCNGCKERKPMHVTGLCRRCYDKKNNSKIKEQHNIWRKNNPEKVKISTDKHRFGGNRQKALERDNFECQECGMIQEKSFALFNTGLIVHHKDGKGRDEKNPNNDIENLITVCFRCHQIVHKKMRDNGIIINDTRGEISRKLQGMGLLEQNDSEYKYPKLRELLFRKEKILGTIGKAKKDFAKSIGASYDTIDHMHYERKTSQSHSKEKSE